MNRTKGSSENIFPVFSSFRSMSKKYFGGFGPGVPPLPIPNREVKPGHADGTAPQCGRVGRRLLNERALCTILYGGLSILFIILLISTGCSGFVLSLLKMY